MLGLLACCAGVTDEGGSSAELSEEDGDPPGFARVALDARGNAIVVWHWWGFDVGTIRSRRYAPGIGWGPIEQIDSGEQDAVYPALAADPSGNAVAVWIEVEVFDEEDPNKERIAEIWANRYTVGVGWGAAARIDKRDEGHAGDPHVAMDLAGNAIAVWHQSDSIRENIWSNRSTPDGSWDIAQIIDTGAGHAGDPRVAMDSEGNAIAVWHQTDGTRANIWSNRFIPRSEWGAAMPIGNREGGEARLPDVAMDPDGHATVVWHESDGERSSIWSSRYDGTWREPERIDAHHLGDAHRPKVGMDADGNALAVWKQFDGNTVGVWSNRATPAGEWTTPERIEANDQGDALRPRLAVSAAGDAAVVWLQSDGLGLAVWSNAYTTSDHWGDAGPIDPRSGDRAREEPRGPTVAMDPAGNAIAVWGREVQTTEAGGAISFANEGSIWSARRTH